MTKPIDRRTVIKAGLLGSALPWVVCGANASAAPLVDLNDPVAKSLGYVADTAKVVASENPTHTATQRCDNCLQFQGKKGDKQGACNLFPGKDVAGPGWCKVWAQKPGA
jgi:hypothetical protein